MERDLRLKTPIVNFCQNNGNINVFIVLQANRQTNVVKCRTFLVLVIICINWETLGHMVRETMNNWLESVMETFPRYSLRSRLTFSFEIFHNYLNENVKVITYSAVVGLYRHYWWQLHTSLYTMDAYGAENLQWLPFKNSCVEIYAETGNQNIIAELYF